MLCKQCLEPVVGRANNAKFCSKKCCKKAQYARHKDQIRAKSKKWMEANKDRVKANKQAYYAACPARAKSTNLRKYGITLVQYLSLVQHHDSKCALCRCSSPGHRGYSWFVDHDHGTGKVRGILCNNCNQGLGKLRDSSRLLRIAANYIESFR